jgi:hypothetical protein
MAGNGGASHSASWVQAVCTVILVGITAYYATLTSKLLEVQVDPVIEMRVDLPTQTLALENYGFNDVVKVRVDVATFLGPNSRGNFFSLDKLKAGHTDKRSFKTEATVFAHNIQFSSTIPELRKGQNNIPTMVFRATYFREPDHRFYSKTTRVIVLGIKTGYQLVDPNFGPFDISKSEETFPEMPTEPPVAAFDNSGNLIRNAAASPESTPGR